MFFNTIFYSQYSEKCMINFLLSAWLLSLCPLISHTDVSRHNSCSCETAEMQNILIRLFFRDIAKERFDEIMNGEQNNACSWQCIICEDVVITEVAFTHEKCGNFRIEYLPQSIEILEISDSNQQYALNVRCFPQSVQLINLSRNRIFGTVDLQVLPEGIEELNLCTNCIVGPVSLIGLPSQIRVLNLRDNSILQRIVWHDGYPDSMTYVSLCQNEIGKIKYAEKYGKEKEWLKT